jgi:hypothetical protein
LDSGSSPARRRHDDGDDRWGPPVGSCGAGEERSGLATIVGRLVGCNAGLLRRKRAEANTWRGAGGLRLLGWARKEGRLE